MVFSETEVKIWGNKRKEGWGEGKY